MLRSLLLGIVGLGIGLCLVALVQQSAETQQPQGQNPNPAPQTVDLRQVPLDRIPVGTVIGQQLPQGWTNLVIFAVPTLAEEDAREAPAIAVFYARMFKFTILANVAGQRNGNAVYYYLDKVARGFATTVKGQEIIVSGQNTMNADLKMFGKKILDENEKHIDADVRQLVRTNTMLIFDAQAVMRRNDAHVNMIMRHALLVDPETGRLYSLVWLLTKDYQAAEGVMQLLPPSMHEERLLSVDRNKFNFLGIPEREAFALRRVPPGTPIQYDKQLLWAATLKNFTAYVPELETILRETAKRAAAAKR